MGRLKVRGFWGAIGGFRLCWGPQGGGEGCQNRGGEEEVLLAGLFEGLLPDFSPELR